MRDLALRLLKAVLVIGAILACLGDDCSTLVISGG